MTFAPLGGRQGRKPYGLIWHEVISGRLDEDVTSTYVKFINVYKRDPTSLILWVDNCSAQNNNWTLFTVLCQLANDSDYTCDKITLKYFEQGHTFMAADSFHKIFRTRLHVYGSR